MSLSTLIDADFWLAKEIWTEHEIPYLFLGLEPPPLGKSDYLNPAKSKLRKQYSVLIADSVENDKLVPLDMRSYYKSFKSNDVKEWRETVPFIKPVQAYLDMEACILSRENGAEPIKETPSKPPVTAKLKQRKGFIVRDALGRAMKEIALNYKNKNQLVTGQEMLGELTSKLSATIKKNNRKEFISYTDVKTKTRKKVSKDSFEGRFTRIRKWIYEE